MLRIDVNVADSASDGTSAADNPFVARPPARAPEIWAFGMRNPWRYCFDEPARGGTGALVIGDVGQDAWEEIDYEPAGPRRPQLRMAEPRGRARQRHVARRRRSAADGTDLTNTTAAPGSRSPAGSSTAARALGAAYRAAISSPTSSRVACGRLR